MFVYLRSHKNRLKIFAKIIHVPVYIENNGRVKKTAFLIKHSAEDFFEYIASYRYLTIQLLKGLFCRYTKKVSVNT